MFGPKPGPESVQDFVFPDWSPYLDLPEAARAYFRDPDLALDALGAALGGFGGVLGFTLERMVGDDGMVWQEAAVTDGSRLVLWHGEDVMDDDLPEGAMTSAVRTVPLSRVTEVGYRQLLVRADDGPARVHGVDVYVLLESLDEAATQTHGGEHSTVLRHDAIRLGKTLEAGGPGQMRRLSDFAHLIGGLTGSPLRLVA